MNGQMNGPATTVGTGSDPADLPIFLTPALVYRAVPPTTGPGPGSEGRGRRTAAGVAAHSAVRAAADNEFWRLVAALRVTVSERMAHSLAGMDGVEQRVREELGRDHIQRVVQDANEAMLEEGRPGWSDPVRQRLAKALFDATFRLGRLQELVEIPTVENIEIYGHDRVVLLHADGTRTEAAPVAESDQDLVNFLQFLASRDPDLERTFTRGSWDLNMPLPGRARLAAAYWTTPRPRVTIRLQQLKQVDLAALEAVGTLDRVLHEFLAAAVRAHKSIVVSGQGQGSGKTTLLRALCAALDPWESVATIETDFELYLHDDPERHRRVLPLQARTGTGEMTAAGTRAGEVGTGDLIRSSLRHNIDRIIVGEVRGSEIVAMFEAMQAGNGSMSTVHADSARDVVERLVGLAVKDSSLSEEYSYRQVVQSIDLIVYLARDLAGDGRSRRYVSEIIEVTRGERGNPVAVTQVFGPDRLGRAVPRTPPTFLPELERAGFRRDLLHYADGLWEAR